MEALLKGLTGDNIAYGVEPKSGINLDENTFVVRVNLTNREDCNRFMRQLSDYTNTQWIVAREKSNSERYYTTLSLFRYT